MRRNLTQLVLTGLLLLGGLATSKAQTPPVLPYGQIWSYLLTNATPVGWSASNYPAASDWWIGAGVLAFPINEAMPTSLAQVQTLLDTNFNGNIITTFYFRTEFTLTQAITSNFVINASAIVDDGAVIYINGREIERIRMPTGAINHRTLASGGGDVASRIDTFSIAGTNFVRGTNVVAVEVHQDAGTSSDVVFGLQLTPARLDPVRIVNQPYPAAETIDTGKRATFRVGALGSNVRYQWYTNDVPIPNAVLATYTTPFMNNPSTGIVYHVVASNSVNTVRSSNVVLTVVTDQNGPIITNLVTPDFGFSNRVRLDFNEAVLSSAIYPAITNKENFAVFILGTTNQIAVTNVVFGTANFRLWLAENLNLTNDYMICAYNLPDARSNFTASTCATFSTIVHSNIFPLGSEWRLQNTAIDLSQENWEAPTYDDSPNNGWGEGFGAFVFDPSTWFNPCAQRGSSTSKGPRTTYFRKDFSVTPAAVGPTNPVIRLRFIADDGAVFYLNGQEIHRYLMPAAPTPVNYSTVATGTVGDATVCQNVSIEIPRGLFLFGANANTIAVELHQQEGDLIGGDSDLAFDLQLDFERVIEPVLPISSLTITRGSGSVLVTWTNPTGFVAQQAPAITGPWTDITPNVGNNGFQVTPGAGQQRFFRTRPR